jgi:hypothetical protein
MPGCGGPLTCTMILAVTTIPLICVADKLNVINELPGKLPGANTKFNVNKRLGKDATAVLDTNCLIGVHAADPIIFTDESFTDHDAIKSILLDIDALSLNVLRGFILLLNKDIIRTSALFAERALTNIDALLDRVPSLRLTVNFDVVFVADKDANIFNCEDVSGDWIGNEHEGSSTGSTCIQLQVNVYCDDSNVI